MYSIVRRIISKLTETKWFYRLSNSQVRVINGGQCEIASTAVIKNSYIYVGPNSNLVIKDNVKIDGVGLFVYEGTLTIGEDTIIEREKNSFMPEYIVDNASSVAIADHVRLRCQRIWVRFQGVLIIGSYTNVNTFSEIRCDESVCIGSFCRISYNNRIWDTNTHSILPSEVRKERTVKYFPSFGYENSRPVTKPILIGEGCWLGENVTILKGTNLGDNVIVGFNTVVSNKVIENGKKVVARSELKIL